MTAQNSASPGLFVQDWGAVCWPAEPGAAATTEGGVAGPKDIPAGLRRRLGHFERAIVQAVIGLGSPGAPVRVTLGSRFGNLDSASSILRSIDQGEPPSPTLFSHSVLNAGCGVANQVRGDRSSHTAVSAGVRTAHGALTEAWLQMGEATADTEHVVVLVDAPFPDCYQPLDTGWRAGMCIGLRVAQAAPCDGGQPLGCEGYAELLSGLRQGARHLGSSRRGWELA